MLMPLSPESWYTLTNLLLACLWWQTHLLGSNPSSAVVPQFELLDCWNPPRQQPMGLEGGGQTRTPQKDHPGLPECFHYSGLSCQQYSWPPVSSPSSLWICWATSILVTRPGPAGSCGARCNMLQPLETLQASAAQCACPPYRGVQL